MIQNNSQTFNRGSFIHTTREIFKETFLTEIEKFNVNTQNSQALSANLKDIETKQIFTLARELVKHRYMNSNWTKLAQTPEALI